MKKLVLSTLILSLSLWSSNGEELAKEYDLIAGTKAIKQWERLFKRDRKLKRLGLDKLSKEDLNSLKEYLIKHAADSDQPKAAGL